jgi:hypothetical protein
MTREEFIQILDEVKYHYNIKGDKIIINKFNDYINFDSLISLPSGVEFMNKGSVSLESLDIIPHGVIFSNNGNVYLNSLKNIPKGVEFNNSGGVFLIELNSIDRSVEFRNLGNIRVANNKVIPGLDLEIEGVNSNRLLNLMIKQGVFER